MEPMTDASPARTLHSCPATLHEDPRVRCEREAVHLGSHQGTGTVTDHEGERQPRFYSWNDSGSRAYDGHYRHQLLDCPRCGTAVHELGAPADTGLSSGQSAVVTAGTGAEEGVCSDCAFWDSAMAGYTAGTTFVTGGGQAYSFGPRGGFGDKVTTVTFADGRVVDNACLWFNGTVPAEYRAQMPDNAAITDWRRHPEPANPNTITTKDEL